MSKKHSKAFTLIEMLMVLLIIGIISSLVWVNLRNARERARIGKGLQFSHSIQHGLGAYAVGVWRFEGTTINDESGYDNDCILHGTTPGEGLPQLGNARLFNGIDDYLDCQGGGTLKPTEAVTIEAWVNITDFTSLRVVAGNGGYLLYVNTDGTINMWLNNSSWHNVGASAAYTWRDKWHHLAATYDSSLEVAKYYRDGELVFTTAELGSLSYTPGNFLIGSEGTNYFYGLIDEVRVYNQPLKTADIYKHYVEGLEKHNLALGD